MRILIIDDEVDFLTIMESVLRDRFSTWHGVANALFLAQSQLGIALVVLQERGRGR